MPGDVDAVYRLAHEVVPGQEGLPAVAADPHGRDLLVAPRQAVSHVEGLGVRQREEGVLASWACLCMSA